MTVTIANVAAEYLHDVRARIDTIAQDQSEAIGEAAALVARTLECGGLIHTFGTGHSHLLAEEIYSRAGGLLPVNVIESAPLMLHEDVVASGAWERTSGVAALMLEHAGVDPLRDMLIVISNSGRNAAPVEAAEWARAHAMPVVALTSLAHSRSLPPSAPSGKRLCEVADVVLDNLGLLGDALVEVRPGVQIGATSTVIGACLLQCVVVQAVDVCFARGIEPPLLVSANTTGAAEANARVVRDYAGRLPMAYVRKRQRILDAEARP
jgi:uncharacterized phosphosugar-binding protein